MDITESHFIGLYVDRVLAQNKKPTDRPDRHTGQILLSPSIPTTWPFQKRLGTDVEHNALADTSAAVPASTSNPCAKITSEPRQV